MSAPAVTTVRPLRPSGAHRAHVPALERSPSRRVTLAAACYVGLGLIVGLAVLVHQVLPTPVAAPLFVLACIMLVARLHPRITLRR